ncbi:MAG: transporter [Rhodocyclales bacterium]|nr:transporter [Rhodocyclales bacterium]
MAQEGITKEERTVIFASSLGTVFEWYDFYLFITLASVIGANFSAGLDETGSLVFSLCTFAAGFIVRPFGAIIFGRLGDMIGRKYTFLMTILIMGFSTAAVGILPTYASIGVAAPILLIALRLLQGLALGGEYGGAATYVAEHAPKGKRGYFTSWIQTTATLGLFLSLIVITLCRMLMSKEFFEADGWRLPFLISILLLIISVYIRMKLHESPVFQRMKAEGKSSKAPLTESFLRWGNAKIVLLALFGATAGQAVVWYCGQFYAQIFMLNTLKLDLNTTNLMLAAALLIATPFFVVFGSLSDRIGRKPIIMIGCILAAATYIPIFSALTQYGNPDLYLAQQNNTVTVTADPATCSVQFDPIGKRKFTSSCDIATGALAKRSVNYVKVDAAAGSVAQIKIGDRVVSSYEGTGLPKPDAKTKGDAFAKDLGAALKDAGYPEKADMSKVNKPAVIALLAILVLYVTMVYGPIAAWLVELFPTRIRYTSMSLPYHIGNGWFGGLLPAIGVGMVVASGNIYHGLLYPIVVAVMTAVIGTLFLPETKDRDIT